uniref:Uncharacterized protein n=1 Tax=Knipowitschia caucasica TaxID=637954 RepID=A0AAV2J9A3_KNICA
MVNIRAGLAIGRTGQCPKGRCPYLGRGARVSAGHLLYVLERDSIASAAAVFPHPAALSWTQEPLTGSRSQHNTVSA